MKSAIRLLGITFFVAIIGFSMIACDHDQVTDTSPPPKVRNYEEQISFIFRLSNKFTLNEMGTVNYSEDSYKMYRITYNESAENNRRYLVICAIHGHEEAPVYAIKDFILNLDSQENMFENVTVDFIYILNPYGFEHHLRYNGDGHDLNRDFYKNFKTREIQILINSVKDIQYTGMFDFHEHRSSNGFFLEYYQKSNKQLALQILRMMRENNFELDNEYIDVILKSNNGEIYVTPYAKWAYENILKQASTGVYFDKIAKEVFIFETPHKLDIESRKKMVNFLLTFLFSHTP